MEEGWLIGIFSFPESFGKGGELVLWDFPLESMVGRMNGIRACYGVCDFSWAGSGIKWPRRGFWWAGRVWAGLGNR